MQQHFLLVMVPWKFEFKDSREGRKGAACTFCYCPWRRKKSLENIKIQNDQSSTKAHNAKLLMIKSLWTKITMNMIVRFRCWWDWQPIRQNILKEKKIIFFPNHIFFTVCRAWCYMCMFVGMDRAFKLRVTWWHHRSDWSTLLRS